MPIRTASLSRQLEKNGARLHRAMASRIRSHGADGTPSEEERALLEERRALKQARAERQAKAQLPRQKPVWVPRAKPPKVHKEPKAPKPAKEHKDAKGSKPSRADKQTRKAESLEAAKKAAKKSAKT